MKAFFNLIILFSVNHLLYSDSFLYLESEELDEDAFVLDVNMSLQPRGFSDRILDVPSDGYYGAGNIFFILAKTDGVIEVTFQGALNTQSYLGEYSDIALLNGEITPSKSESLYKLENSTPLNNGKNELFLSEGLMYFEYYGMCC